MKIPTQDEKRKNINNRLTYDLPYFSVKCLKIKDKKGRIVPFAFNSAQEYLHKRLEAQRKELGRVRAIVVKGRQQGCSTYIGGRFYHRSTRFRGKNVFILSHEGETTKKLFAMVERFYNKSPDATKPHHKIANRREFKFDQIDSEYAVGTAGNEDVGRGGTVQLFHGSEVAFWEKTDGIETGILQSIADMDGTEIILESTANGMGNMFYRKCMDALEGKSDYQVIFIPWYWQTEYRRDIPADGDMSLSEEELEYQRLYDLDNEQIYWRRAKIVELKSLWKFRQEYPAFLQEAFQTSGDTLISPESIMKARKSTIVDRKAPLIMGVDPGRNKDRTVFVMRQGRQLWEPEIFRFGNDEEVQMLIAGKIAQRINKYSPQKVFIDVGEGRGTIDRLKELGFRDVVQGVHFGSMADEDDIYINKRAEMWCRTRDWFHGEDGEVSIPDSDEIQKDLMSMPGPKETSSGKTKMVEKEQIKKIFGMSPDIGDAIVLTFAFMVRNRDNINISNRIRKKHGNQSELITLRRKRGYNNAKSEKVAFWVDQ